MAKFDVKMKGNGNDMVVQSWQTEAAATDIKAGEPVKLKTVGSEYVIPLATVEPIIGTTTPVMGIAVNDSDHTASADGTVLVMVPKAGQVFRCKATTAGNVASTIVGNAVTFELVGSTYTVDENDVHAAVNGLLIVGVDTDTDEVLFSFRPGALEGVIV